MGGPGQHDSEQAGEAGVELPAPTMYPIVLAMGITLLFGSVVLDPFVLWVGLALSLFATVGWCFDALPGHGKHVTVPLEEGATTQVKAVEPRASKLTVGQAGHRARIPVEVHPYTAGVFAGVAGGAAMAVVAVGYGLLAEGSPWMPINLLSAGLLSSVAEGDVASLQAFNATALAVGVGLHGALSIMMGLVYVVTLPMFPDRPVLVGGLLVPAFWTSLIWATLGLIDPTLEQHINWLAFALSQFVFGVVAGQIVARSRNIETMQTWTMAERLGVEAPGLAGSGKDDGKSGDGDERAETRDEEPAAEKDEATGDEPEDEASKDEEAEAKDEEAGAKDEEAEAKDGEAKADDEASKDEKKGGDA